MSSWCSHRPRLAIGALAIVSFLTAGSVAVPAAGQQCRGTKQWFEGACRYPDEIAKLEAERDKEAAAARQRAELQRREAEAARRKAEEERLKAEAEQRKAEEERLKAERDNAPPPEPSTSDLPPDEPVADAPSDPGTAPTPGPAPDQAETEGISPLAYVGFAVAGVGVLVGGITGGLSMSQAADLQDRCPDDVCAPDIEGEVDTMMALGHVSTVSFVVAGAGAAVGLYGLFTSGPEPETETARVIQPVLGPGFTGVRGTF